MTIAIPMTEEKKEYTLWQSMRWPVFFVAVLWLIEGICIIFNIRFYDLGIIPRTSSGIPGIFLSPFIHGNYEHLLSNTLPLVVVGTGLFYFYRQIAWNVILMLWLFTDFWVWLAARQNAHIGASGLIYGFVCFLFFSGILRKNTQLMAISLLVAFLYGSMVWGILPIDQAVSWESHLFGSIAGIFCAIYYRKMGPQREKTQWELEEEQEAVNDDLHAGDSADVNITYHFVEKKNESSEEDDSTPKQN